MFINTRIFDLDMNAILETTKFVIENSKSVNINNDRITEVCKTLKKNDLIHWWAVAPFNIKKLSDEEKLTFLLVVNSISFSYWGKPKWTVVYKGNEIQSGAFGLIAAIGKAYENNKLVLNAEYLSNIRKEDFVEILKANVEIPLFEERWKIIREI